MENSDIEFLFRKYIQGSLTEEEAVVLQSYMDNPSNQDTIKVLVTEALCDEDNESLQNIEVEDIIDNLEAAVRKRVAAEESLSEKKVRPMWRYIAAAVVVMLSIGLGYWAIREAGQPTQQTAHLAADIEPGTNRAMLKLADGRVIPLSEIQEGIQLVDNGIQYADGTALLDTAQPQLVTMSVPRGGQYQLTLSDGTKVWLNAASTLTYPTQFQDGERVVELEGEAYFEVKHNSLHPFVVETRHQAVQVLGTSFNINAYTDEKAIYTTLVEGSVALNNKSDKLSRVLKPGEQSVWKDEKFSTRKVDVTQYTGWKDGLIVFSEADLPAIVRQIERWYDVEFDMPDLSQTEKVYGEVRRDANLSEILHALELNYGLTFKREGRRIMVSK